jgi:hypothetical protein
MYHIVLETEFNQKRFLITDHIPNFGSFLFVYENDFCTYDYFQNSIQFCKETALEEFGVPMDSWKEVDYMM